MAEALIVGGGIGGVAAALALRQAGWSVRVIERAAEIKEVGAGVQISPNGMKVLEALGLADAVEARGYEPESFNLRLGRSGMTLFSVKTKEPFRRRYGAPYLQIHRADLIDILSAALRERAPEAVRTGAEAESYRLEADGPILRLTSGETLRADLLVGADGVHSKMREAMLGPEQPRFTGNVAWRAVVEADQLRGVEVPPGPCVWAGPGRHAVTYPLRRGELVNFVGVVERDGWEVESWTEQASRQEALADFAGWSPLIERILTQAPAHFRWALFDRAPLPRWSDGAVALLGDACHPMLPTLAQGACQALEDAWVLAKRAAECDGSPTGLAQALRRYEAERKQRTALIQSGARRMARFFHHRTLTGAALAYGPAWLAGRLAPEAIRRRNDWIYRHDVVGSSR